MVQIFRRRHSFDLQGILGIIGSTVEFALPNEKDNKIKGVPCLGTEYICTYEQSISLVFATARGTMDRQTGCVEVGPTSLTYLAYVNFTPYINWAY